MCGIAGISMSPGDKSMDTRKAAVALLKGIASRGPDATGAAWYVPEQDGVALTKVAVPVWRFLEAREGQIPRATPTMILHTRFTTKGSASNRLNNHPVQHGNIMGVHNGVLQNDSELFRQLAVKRNAEVDSEAIFALINHSDDAPTKELGRIRGDAAVAWIDIRKPEVLHLARVTGRPLYIAQTKSGSLLFASTKEAVRDAVEAVGATIEYEGEMKDEHYSRVEGGVIKDYMPIEGVVSTSSSFRSRYAYTSGATTTGGTSVPVAGAPAFSHAHEYTTYAAEIAKKPLPQLLQLARAGSYVARKSIADRYSNGWKELTHEECRARLAELSDEQLLMAVQAGLLQARNEGAKRKLQMPDSRVAPVVGAHWWTTRDFFNELLPWATLGAYGAKREIVARAAGSSKQWWNGIPGWQLAQLVSWDSKEALDEVECRYGGEEEKPGKALVLAKAPVERVEVEVVEARNH